MTSEQQVRIVGAIVYIAVMLLIVAAAVGAVRAKEAERLAQPKLQWTSAFCMTNSCIADTLNGLSPERASEAKLTTWSNYTYVWYRK